MYDKIKSLRIQAMKDRNHNDRVAYEGVLSILDNARGRGIDVNSTYIINTVKREIKAYQEMDYDSTAVYKMEALTNLLPEQVSIEVLSQLAISYPGIKQPKFWFEYLDGIHPDAYNKKSAMELFVKHIKD